MREALGRQDGCRSRSSAMCCTRGWPAPTSRACDDGRRRAAGRPADAIPRGIEAHGRAVSHDIADIADADVVYVLRMQHERMHEGSNFVPTPREYTARWGVTRDRVPALAS